MLGSNIKISIITLVKNDYSNFIKTLKSIKSQRRNFSIECLIINGSKKNKLHKYNRSIDKILDKKEKILITHINSNELNLNGIYPCMNYGKKVSKGQFIIFLNSGDTFYDENSLKILFNKTSKADINNTLIFGQAKIIGSKNISWYYPGKRLKNIKTWLKYFDPNHQTMLISNSLANRFEFLNNTNIIADGYWKRLIINNASEIIYIKKPVIKFLLDGVSSTKPSKKIIKKLIQNKNISLLRKIIFLIKYLFPAKFFFLYHLMQK